MSTRDKLIDAAFRMVARDRLEAASVKAIAAEAEVAPGLMHHHFATKDAVLAAAMGAAPSDRHRAVAHTLKAMFDGIMLAALIDPAFPIEAAAGLIEGSMREWLTA